MIRDDIIDLFRVQVGKKFRLRDQNPGWKQTAEFEEFGKEALKDKVRQILDQNLLDLAEAQSLLYADDRYAVLIVLRAMDAAGKDGTIKHVMSGSIRRVARCSVSRSPQRKSSITISSGST
jgi:polyphosphate kinase 2 (PPK2 family)